MSECIGESFPERSNELVVTTRSGARLTLRPWGFDREGNQLWLQVKAEFGR